MTRRLMALLGAVVCAGLFTTGCVVRERGGYDGSYDRGDAPRGDWRDDRRGDRDRYDQDRDDRGRDDDRRDRDHR